MGILNDLKAIFFGASSVAKSATEKTTDYVKEHGDELLDKGKDMAENIGAKVMDTANELKDTVFEKSKKFMDIGEETVSSAGSSILENETVQNLSNKAKEVGGIAMEKGEKLMDKFGDVSERVGGQLMEKGGELSEQIGEKVLAAKEVLVEKAGQASEAMKQKFDDTVDKAEKWEAEQKDKYQAGFPKEDFDASGSLLEGKDDFFSKADKFASGDYDAAKEGKITITDADPSTITPKQISRAAGFEDLDNDGNELIDDALLE